MLNSKNSEAMAHNEGENPEGKKKKKRRKNKKKRKKKDGVDAAMPSTDAPNAPNDEDGVASECDKADDDSTELEDPEFEENLK